MNADAMFTRISDLILCHSPSGDETEVDRFISGQLADRGVEFHTDSCGNIIVYFPGSSSGSLAITAHKDEIGGIVTRIEDDGRVRVRKLGGSYPWVYGEGVVDLLGEDETVYGILSFGSRHVSSAPQSAQKETDPVRWADVWIETKRSPDDLEEAGVRPGTRMVVGKHRKTPFRLGDYVAGYGLDNKASLAVLIELATRINKPAHDIYLVATAKEEPGAVGALYFSQRHAIDTMIALEIAPIAPEYTIKDDSLPVLFAEDSHGLYDQSVNQNIRRIASELGIETQTCIFNGFGSDASICAKHGHVGRPACIGFPALNTHGYEVANLYAIRKMLEILTRLCE